MTEQKILAEAEQRLKTLSPGRLRTANDFLAYLQEREENEATAELLRISGFQEVFQKALVQVKEGDVVRFDDVRSDV